MIVKIEFIPTTLYTRFEQADIDIENLKLFLKSNKFNSSIFISRYHISLRKKKHDVNSQIRYIIFLA